MPTAPLLWDAQSYRKDHPDCEPRVIDPVHLDYLGILMEVRIRSNGEYFKVRIDEIEGDKIIGKVITEVYPLMSQPFKQYDEIEFRKENVIDVFDIPKVGIIL